MKGLVRHIANIKKSNGCINKCLVRRVGNVSKRNNSCRLVCHVGNIARSNGCNGSGGCREVSEVCCSDCDGRAGIVRRSGYRGRARAGVINSSGCGCGARTRAEESTNDIHVGERRLVGLVCLGQTSKTVGNITIIAGCR